MAIERMQLELMVSSVTPHPMEKRYGRNKCLVDFLIPRALVFKLWCLPRPGSPNLFEPVGTSGILRTLSGCHCQMIAIGLGPVTTYWEGPTQVSSCDENS